TGTTLPPASDGVVNAPPADPVPSTTVAPPAATPQGEPIPSAVPPGLSVALWARGPSDRAVDIVIAAYRARTTAQARALEAPGTATAQRAAADDVVQQQRQALDALDAERRGIDARLRALAGATLVVGRVDGIPTSEVEAAQQDFVSGRVTILAG